MRAKPLGLPENAVVDRPAKGSPFGRAVTEGDGEGELV